MPIDSNTTIFTTALSRFGDLKWMDEHLARLKSHADIVGLPCPGREILLAEISGVIDTNALQLVRIAIRHKDIEIKTRPLVLPSAEDYAGASIIVTDIKVDPTFARLKTEHRDPYIAAHSIGARHRAFEALLLDNEGYIADGSRSSPLLFRGETLVSLEGGIQGITRNRVLERATALGLRTECQRRKPHELDGILLVAGSGMGLVPSTTPGDERMRQLIREFQIHKPA